MPDRHRKDNGGIDDVHVDSANMAIDNGFKMSIPSTLSHWLFTTKSLSGCSEEYSTSPRSLQKKC